MHIYNIKHMGHKNLGGLQPPSPPIAYTLATGVRTIIDMDNIRC